MEILRAITVMFRLTLLELDAGVVETLGAGLDVLPLDPFDHLGELLLAHAGHDLLLLLEVIVGGDWPHPFTAGRGVKDTRADLLCLALGSDSRLQNA